MIARWGAWPGRWVQEWSGTASGAMIRRVVAGGSDLIRSISGYSVLTAIGLVLGFVRELTVAATYGLSPQLDVFVAVMTVQLFFGAQVGNALETAFISGTAGRCGARPSDRPLRHALSSLCVVNGGIVLCLWGGGEALLGAIFPHFGREQLVLATHTLHALLPPMVCASTAGLLRGSLAARGMFAPGFLSGSIVSASTIGAVVFSASRLGIDALTLGVAIGNLLVLGLFACRLLLLETENAPEPAEPAVVIRPSAWWALWGSVATVMAGELVYAGVALTERSVASQLPGGSIAALFYAHTVISVPLSLFIVPLTTVLFPGMVETFARDPRAGLSDLRARLAPLVAVTLVMALCVIPWVRPLVELLFMRGQFSAEHAALTASILSVMILALPVMSVSRLVRNACYALSHYRIPVMGLLVQWVVLATLGVLLLPDHGVRGVAVAVVAGEAALLGTMGGLLLRMIRT